MNCSSGKYTTKIYSRPILCSSYYRTSTTPIPSYKYFESGSLNSLPIFCFPDFIKKMPLGLTYCFLYMIGCLVLIGIGFYIYTRFLVKKFNGHADYKQNTEGKQANGTLLRRMLSGRQNSKMQQVSVINGGEPRPIK